MTNRKLVADLKVLIVLLSFLGSISAVTLSSPAKPAFLGVVYGSPAFPLENAYVTASGPEGYGAAWTDASGQYSITEGLASGNYTVTASAEGYLDAEIEDVVVTEGLETSNVDFTLTVSGGISGKITEDGTAVPLPTVLVTAQSSAGGGVSESAFTNANGDYLINTNLVTGTYNITASYATGHLTKSVSGIAVTAGLETENVDLALEKSGILSGIVTDSVSSAPLADVSIVVSDEGGTFGGFAITNSSGRYRVDSNLGTGTYNVSALFPDGHVSKEISGIAVTAGSETSADLALDPSGIISGTVTTVADSSPVEGANVFASSGDFSHFGSAETDATGHYRIESGLATDTYMVSASFESAFDMVFDVEVTAGLETSNVDMQLDIAPSGVISGRVTNTTGHPIEGAYVSAEGSAGDGDAWTDENGEYSISRGLGTGTYVVNASASGYLMASLTDVSVTVDEVTADVDFQLPTAPSGTISGAAQADFPAIPELSHPLFVFLFAASIVGVAFGKLRNTRRRVLNAPRGTSAF